MEINKRNRAELKSFFVKNAIPTEGEFADLIDGTLNQKDDGIAKLPGSPLTIEASGDGASQKKAISFYKQFSDPNPSWVLSLNPRSDPDNPATAKPGFSISNAAGSSRFFIDESTGNVGIGTNNPGARLDVRGNIFAGNSDIYFTKTDHNHSAIGNAAGFAAIENARNYDALMILGRAGTTKGRYVRLWDYLQVNGSMDVTGNVGIGVSAPGAKLDINGDIRTNVALISDNPYGAAYASFSHRNQGTAGHYALLQHSAGETFLNAPAGKNINFRINNATKMMVNANGSVSINSLASLNVADSFSARIRCADFNIGHSSRKGGLGRALVDGATVLYINYGPDWPGGVRHFGAMAQVSSRKYKEKIVTLSSKEAIDAVKALNPVKFNLKKDKGKRVHIGFIAEETPGLVATEDKAAVINNHILALLTRVVKDQQLAIASLEKELGGLKRSPLLS